MDDKNYFSDIAQQYQRNRPDYPSEIFQYLSMVCDNHQLAWDVGTGTGQAAAQLANQFDKVIATDESIEQIAHAKKFPNVTYLRETAENATLEDQSVDLITVAQALHWFDFDAFMQQVERVLKPGGIFAAWCYSLVHINPEVDKSIKLLYDDILGDYWSKRRHWIDAGYSNFEFPHPLLMPPKIQMEITWSYQQFADYLRTWSAVQKYKSMEGEDPVNLILQPLEFAWCDTGHMKKCMWPLQFKIFRKPA
ncbi:MAG: class I SAM-dependent methyltransferase [Gammaproteobacteria bacterium]|nr:class I SAM-dependent methyltransferase [Gammaproteobacteria bacterium]